MDHLVARWFLATIGTGPTLRSGYVPSDAVVMAFRGGDNTLLGAFYNGGVVGYNH
jgi:hypothetical protein